MWVAALVLALSVRLSAVGSPEIMADLWCNTGSSLNTRPITANEIADEVKSRLEKGASFVVVCVEYVDEDDVFFRGAFRIRWERRSIAEIIYVPAESQSGSWGGGFVRLFKEVRPINGRWRLDDTFPVQWRPVPGDITNPIDVLDEVSREYLDSLAENVSIAVASGQGQP